MLQRSQTLYLLGVLILYIVMLTGPLARITREGEAWVMKYSGVFLSTGIKMDLATWPLTLFLILVSALALLDILSYRNRIRQMRISIFLIFLSAGMIGMIFYYTWMIRQRLDGALVLYQWRFMVPPICMILLYLAFRRIRRDELLVKAFDRIR
jgi:hypothetical protein